MIPNTYISSLHLAGLKFAYQVMDRPGDSQRGLAFYDMSSQLDSENKEIDDKMIATKLQPA